MYVYACVFIHVYVCMGGWLAWPDPSIPLRFLFCEMIKIKLLLLLLLLLSCFRRVQLCATP